MKYAHLLLVVATVHLSSCGLWPTKPFKAEGPNVAIALKKLPNAQVREAALQNVSVNELIERIEQIKRHDLKQQAFPVASRLTQLQLKKMEDQLAVGQADFKAPLAALTELIDLAPSDAVKSQLYYQKARVQEMSGDLAPVVESLTALIDSGADDSLKLEAHFRRAERLFSDEHYADAEADFALVAENQGAYQLHARYMLCWVRFKRGDTEGALEASVTALNQIAANDNSQFDVLKQDLLRVTVVALDYLDGPDTLAAMMRIHSKPVWQSELYQALGDWYLGKSRFADSAATWQSFLTENPMDEAAPRISLSIMDIQRQAGFVADISNLETDFIQRYGKHADFYQLHGDVVFAEYETPLRSMLDRYAQRLHGKAQNSQADADYEAAATAYELWLANFDQTPEAQGQRFLLAEVRQQAGGFTAARDQFERVIEMDATTHFAQEAAYAVVVGLGNSSLGSVDDIDDMINANLRFASLYPEDARAAVCQLNAANQLFVANRFGQALKASVKALAFKQTAKNVIIARKLIAHSAFEESDYELAEHQYSQVLALTPTAAIKEKLLATVFKLGEQAEQVGNMELAVSHFERLYQIDPKSPLARDASYDLAALHEQNGNIPLAIRQLETFRERYKASGLDLAEEISLRLVALREGSGDLRGAASELLSISLSSQGDTGRVARYRAAELFLKLEDFDSAIEHFRFYAHQYPEPLDLRFEAMHHMDLLYEKMKAVSKQQYWLRQKWQLFESLDEAEKSDRNKYLAASARWQLSSEDFDAFRSAKLSLPLAKSLKRKQKLLDKSLRDLNTIAGIGVFEFVTKSQFRKGQLYQILAQDLVAAEQPKNLNPLEKQQYVLLLEEQAYPFEEKAIELHQQNLAYGWTLGWNESVDKSLEALEQYSPARFKRTEQEVDYVLSAR